MPNEQYSFQTAADDLSGFIGFQVTRTMLIIVLCVSFALLASLAAILIIVLLKWKVHR